MRKGGEEREKAREKEELRKCRLLASHPCSLSFFSHLKTLPGISSLYLEKQKNPLTYDIICANLISDEKLISHLHFRALGKLAWRDKGISRQAMNLSCISEALLQTINKSRLTIAWHG